MTGRDKPASGNITVAPAPARLTFTRGEVRAAVATRRRRGRGVDPIHGLRLAELEKLYAETGNGAYALAAIADAQAGALPLPSWAVDYLDGAALDVLAGRRDGAAKALRLRRGWGTSGDVAFRDLRRAGMVAAHRAAGRTLAEALAVVAAAENIGVEVLRTVWRREGRHFRARAALGGG